MMPRQKQHGFGVACMPNLGISHAIHEIVQYEVKHVVCGNKRRRGSCEAHAYTRLFALENTQRLYSWITASEAGRYFLTASLNSVALRVLRKSNK